LPLNTESLSSCLKLLSQRDRFILGMGVAIQFFLSLFDLLAILLLGVIGTLSVRGIQNSPNGERIESLLNLLGIQGLQLKTQVAFLALFSVLLFVLKTAISAVLGKRMIFFLSRRGAQISVSLFRSMLNQLGKKTLDESRHSRIYAVGTGVSAIAGGVLVQLLSIVTDVILLVVLLVGVFLISPMMSVAMIGVFGSVALILNMRLSKRSFSIGNDWGKLYKEANNHLDESISLYRENFVRGTLEESINKYSQQRHRLAALEAEQRFMPFVSKYVIESVMIVGVFLVAAIQFFQNSTSSAIGQISIFLAATVRVAPAVLRIQQSYLSLRGNLGTSSPTLELINEVEGQPESSLSIAKTGARSSSDSVAQDSLITATKVCFRYSSTSDWLIKDFSVIIRKGDHVAISGESGVGKSSLIDLLLGLEEPELGHISILGKAPRDFVSSNPGYISYVPQKIWLIEGTIRENILLGAIEKNVSDDTLLECLGVAALDEFVLNSNLGLDSRVGPAGSNLSGGQVQRIGIARALINNPKVLVLDESTNALDQETESQVISNIYNKDNFMTVITIAHREQSLKTSNLILRISSGGRVNEKRLNK